MKKKFQILSVCLLVGCSGTQIENCADDKYRNFSSKPSLHYDACKKYLPEGKLTNKLIFDESFGRIKFSDDFYKCARNEEVKDNNEFTKQSLRSKMNNQLYESYYLRCKSIYE